MQNPRLDAILSRLLRGDFTQNTEFTHNIVGDRQFLAQHTNDTEMLELFQVCACACACACVCLSVAVSVSVCLPVCLCLSLCLSLALSLSLSLSSLSIGILPPRHAWRVALPESIKSACMGLSGRMH